jgi:hypothetical protein
MTSDGFTTAPRQSGHAAQQKPRPAPAAGVHSEPCWASRQSALPAAANIASCRVTYAYLWLTEHRQGRKEGAKHRPCAIVVTAIDDEGDTIVTVAPITHAPPGQPDQAVELPLATKQRLGLDAKRSWVVVNEVNRFVCYGCPTEMARQSGP